MSPKRIQMSRAKGWRKPEGAIYVGRPTRWGNPFRVGDLISYSGSAERVGHYGDGYCVGYDQDVPGEGLSAAQAVAMYRGELTYALTPDPDDDPHFEAQRQELTAALKALAGHDLACWCDLSAPCHADVLLDFANGRQNW